MPYHHRPSLTQTQMLTVPSGTFAVFQSASLLAGLSSGIFLVAKTGIVEVLVRSCKFVPANAVTGICCCRGQFVFDSKPAKFPPYLGFVLHQAVGE